MDWFLGIQPTLKFLKVVKAYWVRNDLNRFHLLDRHGKGYIPLNDYGFCYYLCYYLGFRFDVVTGEECSADYPQTSTDSTADEVSH